MPKTISERHTLDDRTVFGSTLTSAHERLAFEFKNTAAHE
jgi:hypothetical protein